MSRIVFTLYTQWRQYIWGRTMEGPNQEMGLGRVRPRQCGRHPRKILHANLYFGIFRMGGEDTLIPIFFY